MTFLFTCSHLVVQLGNRERDEIDRSWGPGREGEREREERRG